MEHVGGVIVENVVAIEVTIAMVKSSKVSEYCYYYRGRNAWCYSEE